MAHRCLENVCTSGVYSVAAHISIRPISRSQIYEAKFNVKNYERPIMTVSYVRRLGTPVLKQFWQDVIQLNDLLRREECPCALAVTTYVCLLSNHNFSLQFVSLSSTFVVFG